jgi:hypothetical protein
MQNPFLDMYRSQLEASRYISRVIFTNTEKLEHLALTTAKTGVDDQLKYAQSLGAVRDVEGAKSLHTAFVAHTPEVLMNYYRSVWNIFADANSEMGKVAETYLEDMKSVASRGATTAVVAQNGVTAPSGAALVNIWANAYQQFADMTKHYMESAATSHTSSESPKPQAKRAKAN